MKNKPILISLAISGHLQISALDHSKNKAIENNWGDFGEKIMDTGATWLSVTGFEMNPTGEVKLLSKMTKSKLMQLMSFCQGKNIFLNTQPMIQLRFFLKIK